MDHLPLLISWLVSVGASGSSGYNTEPKCSPFDFQEKLLEKVVKLDHSSGLMSDQFKEFSQQITGELQMLKTEFKESKTTMKTELTKLEQSIEGPPFLVPGPTENIAASYKAVYQISEWPSPNHPAARAVDGNFAVYSHTGHSLSPWWAMQWCDRVIVARVKIWSRTRTDCSYCNTSQMSNFDVTVDDKLCGSIGSEVAPPGAVNEITCKEPLVGKRLKIQRRGEGVLSIAELQVFSS